MEPVLIVCIIVLSVCGVGLLFVGVVVAGALVYIAAHRRKKSTENKWIKKRSDKLSSGSECSV